MLQEKQQNLETHKNNTNVLKNGRQKILEWQR